MAVEHAACASFVCDYLQTQFDPAHLLSELGFELAQLAAGGLLWRRVLKPRLVRSVHAEIDQEHGVAHQATARPPVKQSTRGRVGSADG